MKPDEILSEIKKLEEEIKQREDVVKSLKEELFSSLAGEGYDCEVAKVSYVPAYIRKSWDTKELEKWINEEIASRGWLLAYQKETSVKDTYKITFKKEKKEE